MFCDLHFFGQLAAPLHTGCLYLSGFLTFHVLITEQMLGTQVMLRLGNLAPAERDGPFGLLGVVLVKWSLGPEADFFFRGNSHPFAELLFLQSSVGGWLEKEKHHGRSEPLILFTWQNVLSSEGLRPQGQVWQQVEVGDLNPSNQLG